MLPVLFHRLVRIKRVIDPALTCASCGYSLQGLEEAGYCPECSLSIAESVIRHAQRLRPAPNLRRARVAFFCIAFANAVAALLCAAAVVEMLWGGDEHVPVAVIGMGVVWLLERSAWMSLAKSLCASSKFRVFMVARLVVVLLFFLGSLLLLLSMTIAGAGSIAVVAFLGLGACAIAAAVGSIAELKFLNEASRRWTTDLAIPLFGWIAVVLAAAAWLSMVSGTGIFILPILCLSYAASSAWALRAQMTLPRRV